MRLKKFVFSFIIILVVTVSNTLGQSVFKNFITARGSKLIDGPDEFCFLSMNIPNLLLIEDNMPFECKNPWRLPNAYEMRDALLSIKQMGGKVARTYVITVRRADDLPGTPKHVLGPGKFNERAFRALDTTLAIANKLGVRLIIPLMDNWKWMGGKGQYAHFRSKNESDFWTDEQLKEDYKKTINYIVNRVNTVTGIRYKNDKAIMIWELGNELKQCPVEWVNEMAAYLKSQDPNHLVNDGIQVRTIQQAIIQSPYVDVLSTHHYEGDPQKMLAHISQNVKSIAGKKPYYLGEFGFASTNALQFVASEALNKYGLAGALIWSLRFHNRDGGFYWHSEPFGKAYKAFHWPGFHSGDAYDEVNLLDWLAYFNQQEKTYPLAAPKLFPIKDVGHISWQGATGAPYYIVQRAASAQGPWRNVSGFVTDADVAYESLFNDVWAKQGKRYYYRVKAIGFSGDEIVSNIRGPVTVHSKFLIDNGANLAQTYQTRGDLSIKKNWCRPFKEDLSRIEGASGAVLIYQVPGRIKEIKIKTFSESPKPALNFYISQDGKHYKQVTSRAVNYSNNQKDYNYRQPIEFILKQKLQPKSHFFKISFKDKEQIGRVEIEYLERN